MAVKEKIYQTQNVISSILSNIYAAIVQTRLDSTIVGWYGLCNEIFGYNKNEIMGESILKLFPNNDLNNIHEYILLWFETHASFEMKVKCVSKENKNFYTLLKCSRINIDGQNFILYSFKETNDTTELKLINFKELLDNMPVIVQILDRKGYNVFYNKKFIDFYTIPPVKEYSLFETRLYEKLGLGAYVERALNGEIARIPPTWINLFQVDEHAPILEYCLEAVFYPIKDATGEVQFLAIFEKIVTEQALAEKLIKENKEKNSLLMKYTSWILSILETSKINPIANLVQQLEEIVLKIHTSLDKNESNEFNFQTNELVLSDDIKNVVLKINGSSIVTLLKFGELYPQFLYQKELSELTGFNSSVISKKIKILLENNLIEEKLNLTQLEDNRKKMYGMTKNGIYFLFYLRNIMQNTALLADRKELEQEIVKNLQQISYLEEKRTKSSN